MIAIAYVLFLFAAIQDIRTLEVPLWVSGLLTINRSVYFLFHPEIIKEDLIGLLICFSIFGISMLVSDIGGADALIAGMIGLYLGWRGLYAIMVALGLCLPYLLWMHCKKQEHSYPFVPFLVEGFFLVEFV